MPTCRAHALPKAGSSIREYEDAWACREDPESGTWRLAVADGATESSFAGLWATMLVTAYAQGQWQPGTGSLADLEDLRRRWQGALSGRPLPWYAEEKLRAGAYATFVGLEVGGGAGEGRWHAVAIGDSCLFQLRGGRRIRSFPFAAEGDLPPRPEAISSGLGADTLLAEAEGAWRPGDSFLLMSDALAHWCLGRAERRGRPFPTLLRLADAGPREFARWVAVRRRSGQLRNDDVTLLVLRFREAAPWRRS
jgi:hypothetical protein